ncbi:MAG: hypothetical protein A3F83_08415 [Candidatus Glassbacteria bacterium RIFCSPLOWO2_12_FULL_58_11]|uniref:Right handed beta helix domain-containing protein n=1 Tax=Candidatus Glassbacteria bacterium RIFCSPLOWO2_12_FULL_58_11 TaxID=1817867 RepID=A0A1F5YY58_9BACT|nr:MAG: hypothetical protein A3F83_08415 [Candidatus Glassbacteria bacterium RIFCSPLOWO2_12_FULL_58_11]
MTFRWLFPAAILLAFSPCTILWAEDRATSGELILERPTLICLGFEWNISGDDNRNSSVAVSYRQAGETVWREALPLLRIDNERTFAAETFIDYTAPDMFAGSIFDLQPGTEYECRLRLSDPDGVHGETERTVRIRTRNELRAAAEGRVLHVYPPDWKGFRQEPSFTGLMQAYQGAGGGDWAVVSERKVRPGDILLIHAGRYKADRTRYSDPLNLDFHGAYVLTAKGTPDKPIVIRAAGDGEVIFDGDSCYRLFDVMAADYHIFESLTVVNCDIAFYAGLKDVAGCSGLTVRNCRLEEVGIAVTTQFAGSRDFCISDNIILGRDDRNRLLGWYDPGVYEASPLRSYYAVKVYGQGHVVCHNHIAWFHDALCVCTYGSPDPDPSLRATAIDFYNNDIHLMTDDFIEADGGVQNIRVLRNRCFNSAQCGLSAQPVYGGPAYYIRNILYHVPWGMAFKFKVQPAGLVLYHNTVIAENRNGAGYSNAHFRNNLFLGTDDPGRELVRTCTNTSYSTWDYNGYRPNRAGGAQFFWKAPRPGVLRDYEIENREEFRSFATLVEFRAGTGQEQHGIEVDYDIFSNVSKPDPDRPTAVYFARDFDFSLREGAAAVDRGFVLPNVNDGFTGAAPDLGALERGAEIPVWGPRR